MPLETLERNNICGIIFSGGPASVYDKDSPHIKEEVWNLIQSKKLLLGGSFQDFY